MKSIFIFKNLNIKVSFAFLLLFSISSDIALNAQNILSKGLKNITIDKINSSTIRNGNPIIKEKSIESAQTATTNIIRQSIVPSVRSKGIVSYQSKNLSTSTFRDGTPISEATSAEEWIKFNNLRIPAYCNYKFNRLNDLTHGKLYNYWAVSSSKQIAPEGWHIPNKFEFLKVVGNADYIPDQTLKTNGNLVIGSQICDPSPRTFTMYKSDGIMPLAGSYCSKDGKFYNTPYSKSPDYVRWEGAWWTSNFYKDNYKFRGDAKPIILKVSSDIVGDAIETSFEVAQNDEGYSIVCFKDYPIDPLDSIEKLKQIPISTSKISQKLKVIDSLVYGPNTTTALGRNKVLVYAMDSIVYTDFLTLGSSCLNTYIKFGTVSDYYKNSKLKTIIDYSIQSGLFLSKMPNIDWPNNKITTLDKTLSSKFRQFDVLIDLSVLPPGDDYSLSIPELNINQKLTHNSTDFIKFNIDTSFINAFNQLPFDKLSANQATKKFSMFINCAPGKYFIGNKRVFPIANTKQNAWPGEKSDCSYSEVKNESTNLKSELSINFIKINQVIHELYKPTLDSLLINGQFIEANALYDNHLVYCLPKYFNTTEENWPNKWLKHKPTFEASLKSKIFLLSKNPGLFVNAFQLANAKNKIVIKKAYYLYGSISDTISTVLVRQNSRTYNDYLISSLIQSTIGFKSFEKVGSDFELFNYNSPILFNFGDLALPAAQFQAEPDIAEPLKLVNLAIALQPANPLGYLYRSKFTGCKKYQMYHDACTVSDWCINCKDLQQAFQLDNNKTKTPSFADELTIRGETVSNNYYETFYIMNCVECQLCFYNICGGGGKSKSVQTGNRGGKYYINSNGNKTYIKK